MTDDRPPLRKSQDADRHPSAPDDPAAPAGARLGRGATTADSVGRPDKDKLVTLEVTVPKSLRKAVRAEAKRRGVSVDHIVAEALRDRRS